MEVYGEHGAVFILGFFMGLRSSVYYLLPKDEVT
jgi:hypothetical protein